MQNYNVAAGDLEKYSGEDPCEGANSVLVALFPRVVLKWQMYPRAWQSATLRKVRHVTKGL
jgi:hypothetical protein